MNSNSAEPGIAADTKGNLFVVWVAHADKLADVFLQKFNADAKPVGTSVKVNPDGTNVKSWFGDPPTIVVAPDGSINIGWNRANSSKGNDLMLSVSHDGGSTFAAPVKVNDDNEPASHGMHSLAVDSGGRIFMAWLDERNVKMPEPRAGVGHHETEPNSEVYFSSSEDGGKTFGANTRLASEVCPCCKTTLLAAQDGRIYVAWRQVLPGDFRHIAVTSSTDGGKTFPEATIVSDDKWQLSACPVSGASLAIVENNALGVTWFTAGDAGQAGVYEARSTDGGKTFSSRNLISNQATSGTPTVIEVSGNRSITFPIVGGKIEIHSADGLVSTIPDALHPATISSGDRAYVCFVRKSGESESVWLTRLRRS